MVKKIASAKESFDNMSRKDNDICRYPKQKSGHVLMTELVVVLTVLMAVMAVCVPAIIYERNTARKHYYRAILMEIVDGEMEILTAGEWRAYSKGEHVYKINAESAQNLPDGHLLLTVEKELLRLEWIPAKDGVRIRVCREVKLP